MVTDHERPDYRLIHEYPLGSMPPMMTHIFENKAGERSIAVKGSAEALMQVSGWINYQLIKSTKPLPARQKKATGY